MSALTALGYAAKAVGERLEPFHYAPPQPRENEVQVAVSHCGVCHTDIQGISDYYGITEFPFQPGHEIVGRVSALGPAVTSLAIGDRVGIGWQGRSCGTCVWCLQGEDQLCQTIQDMGSWSPYGGFGDFVTVDERFAYLLPVDLPSESAAVLMCAGITTYNALRPYAAQTSPRLGIVGVGGLGHLAIQYAHALGFEVTAISSSAEKKQQALDFGADHFIFSRSPEEVRPAYYTFDLLLCTVHGELDWEPLLDLLKKRGRLILAGFPDVTLNSTDLVAHEISITGSFLGNHAAMREMLAFSQAHKIKPAVELMPLSQVNQALERVRQNQARYRIVLVNENGPA